MPPRSSHDFDVAGAAVRCCDRTHAVTKRCPPPMPVRARMRVSACTSGRTCSSPLAQPAPNSGAHRRERSVRGPCFSAEGGAGASWLPASADRPCGRSAAPRRPDDGWLHPSPSSSLGSRRQTAPFGQTRSRGSRPSAAPESRQSPIPGLTRRPARTPRRLCRRDSARSSCPACHARCALACDRDVATLRSRI